MASQSKRLKSCPDKKPERRSIRLLALLVAQDYKGQGKGQGLRDRYGGVLADIRAAIGVLRLVASLLAQEDKKNKERYGTTEVVP
jgi:hypothetical protein